MERKQSLFRSVDKWVILIYLLLVTFGWFTICAASFDYEIDAVLDFGMRSGMQLVWIGVSLALALVLLLIDSKFYTNIAYPLYFLMLGLLVLTIFIAPDTKGSHSWLRIGGLGIQPAEFAKYTTALCLAKYLSSYQFDWKQHKSVLLVALIILVPMAIIVLQSETGTALVFSSFLLMLFREGMNGLLLLLLGLCVLFFVLVLRYNNLPLPEDSCWAGEEMGTLLVLLLALCVVGVMIYHYTRDGLLLKVYGIGIGGCTLVAVGVHSLWSVQLSLTVLAFVVVGISFVLLVGWTLYRRSKTYLWVSLFLVATVFGCFSVDYVFDKVLEPHQQIRIKIVLGLEDDPQGAGYNVRQSQIAIGSGGCWGKGFLNGTQTKLNYVPEQDTDFIFCTVGEEQGFVGSLAVIMLYMALIWRLLFLAERQRSAFSRIYGYGVAGIFFFHFAINIGMVIGILPVIGIPLPFLSYGGSSMLGFTLLVFTFLRLDANRMEVLQA